MSPSKRTLLVNVEGIFIAVRLNLFSFSIESCMYFSVSFSKSYAFLAITEHLRCLSVHHRNVFMQCSLPHCHGEVFIFIFLNK